MGVNLQKRTAFFIKDLHARESMRLGWYRQWGLDKEKIKYLRERKARHAAFLNDLLRQRGLKPAWYSRFFYITGNIFGFFSAFFSEKFISRIEKTLEFWILLRYQEYFRKMMLDLNLRSMIESLRLERMPHNEPGQDVLELLSQIIEESKDEQQPPQPKA